MYFLNYTISKPHFTLLWTKVHASAAWYSMFESTFESTFKVHLKVRLKDDMYALHVQFVLQIRYNAAYKSCILSIIPPIKLILPCCGLNTIFSTWKYKVFPVMEFFGIMTRLWKTCLLCYITMLHIRVIFSQLYHQ